MVRATTDKSEAQIEREVVRWVEKRGGMALKTTSIGRRGFPDRTIFMSGGRIYLVELKKSNGKLSAAQKKMHSELTELGHAVHVVRSVEDLERIIV